MIPAFGYLRVSDPSQLKGDGFTRQREEISKYAKAHGFRIVQWFEERGLTGKTEWGDRPAWLEMVATLNGVRTIIIEKLDRLARDLMIQEHIIADLRKRRVDLISSAEPDLCIDDPSRKLMRQIFGAFAEYDRAMLTAKMMAAKVRIRASGARCEGRKPYGVNSPEEAEILAWMRECRDAGQSFDAIAAALNTAGRTTRYDKPWIGATVCKIVRRKDAR